MPELPEVEAIVSGLHRAIKGRTIREVEVLRPAVVKPQTAALVASRATKRRIEGVRRRGKNILIPLSGGYTIRIHLRLSGELHIGDSGPSSRVILHLNGSKQLVFDEPRALGTVHVLSEEELAKALRGLGPEPLSREFKLEPFVEAARKSKLPAKLFLMSQKYVAGLGNIYAAEVLFRAGIDPRKPMGKVRADKVEALHAAIREMLRAAVKSVKIAYNRRKYKEAAGFVRAVYGREGEPCLRCGGRIRRIEQAGRSTYFCARCQR